MRRADDAAVGADQHRGHVVEVEHAAEVDPDGGAGRHGHLGAVAAREVGATALHHDGAAGVAGRREQEVGLADRAADRDERPARPVADVLEHREVAVGRGRRRRHDRHVGDDAQRRRAVADAGGQADPRDAAGPHPDLVEPLRCERPVGPQHLHACPRRGLPRVEHAERPGAAAHEAGEHHATRGRGHGADQLRALGAAGRGVEGGDRDGAATPGHVHAEDVLAGGEVGEPDGAGRPRLDDETLAADGVDGALGRPEGDVEDRGRLGQVGQDEEAETTLRGPESGVPGVVDDARAATDDETVTAGRAEDAGDEPDPAGTLAALGHEERPVAPTEGAGEVGADPARRVDDVRDLVAARRQPG